jgi:hypothetical protein
MLLVAKAIATSEICYRYPQRGSPIFAAIVHFHIKM